MLEVTITLEVIIDTNVELKVGVDVDGVTTGV